VRAWLKVAFWRLVCCGLLPTDKAEGQIQKKLFVLFVLIAIGIAPFWVLLYWGLGLYVAALIPGAYLVACVASLAAFALTKRYPLFRSTQLILILLLPFFLQWSLGGFANSSAVMAWALLAPWGAVVFLGPRHATWWLGAYLALAALSGVMDSRLAANAPPIPSAVIVLFFVMNIGGLSAIALFLVQYFARALQRERARSEDLLRNMLPGPIAERLKDGEVTIADGYPEASILFADLVNFTPLTAARPPRDVVALLDTIFAAFDQLVERNGLEKIKTIGDGYMVASGVPAPRPDHAEALAAVALEMQGVLANIARDRGWDLQTRIGLDTGPVIAGVIGRKKPVYEVWSDAVNTASRMESHGLPGKIQVTERMYLRLRVAYALEPRGPIEVKGKGTLRTYWLVGRASPAFETGDSERGDGRKVASPA
jgi:adenylate cyclase